MSDYGARLEELVVDGLLYAFLRQVCLISQLMMLGV